MARTARASRGGICAKVTDRGNGRAPVLPDQRGDGEVVTLMDSACRGLPNDMGLPFRAYPSIGGICAQDPWSKVKICSRRRDTIGAAALAAACYFIVCNYIHFP